MSLNEDAAKVTEGHDDGWCGWYCELTFDGHVVAGSTATSDLIKFKAEADKINTYIAPLIVKAKAADGLAAAVKSIDARWSGHESHQCGLTGKEHSDIRAALAAYQATLKLSSANQDDPN